MIRFNMCLLEFQKSILKRIGESQYLDRNMAENFPEPIKDTNLQIQIPVNPNQDK